MRDMLADGELQELEVQMWMSGSLDERITSEVARVKETLFWSRHQNLLTMCWRMSICALTRVQTMQTHVSAVNTGSRGRSIQESRCYC